MSEIRNSRAMHRIRWKTPMILQSLMLLCCHSAKGEQPIGEVRVFQGSDVVAVVTLGNSGPSALRQLKPRYVAPMEALRPCQLQARLITPIKGNLEGPVTIHWLTLAPSCTELIGGLPLIPGEDAIVNLAKEGSHYRFFSDSAASIQRLGHSGAALSNLFRDIPTAERKLSFAWLYDPLMIRPRKNKAVAELSFIRNFWGLVGLVEMIQTMTRVYKVADTPAREAICTLASTYQLCTSCRTEMLLRSGGPRQEIEKIQSRTAHTVRALKQERMEALEVAFEGGPEVVREELIFRSCHSQTALRQRARYLLKKHFPAQPIPICIPCK